MLQNVGRRWLDRKTPVRRFVERNPLKLSGAAGATALAVLAAGWIARSVRSRRSRDRIALLSTDGPHEPTRAELYEEARRRDIPGRSTMTKKELEAALESA